MAQLKKGLTIFLAAATAFAITPASIIRPVSAYADSQLGDVNINVTSSTSSLGSGTSPNTYTADAASSGTYRLTADNSSAWNALRVTNSGSTILDGSTFSIAENGTFTPVFTDTGKGLNGTYRFTLTYLGNGTVNTITDKVTYVVTLSGSQATGLTKARLSSIKNGSATVIATRDQLGRNETYSLDNGKSYEVSFTAPSFKPSGTELISEANTTLEFSIVGSSVAYTADRSITQKTLTAIQSGTSTVTATWKAAADIGSQYKTGDTIDTVTFTVTVPDTSNDPKITYESGGSEVTAIAGGSNTAISLDTIITKSEQIHVSNNSTIPTFVSTAPSIATVAQDGTVTAVSRGTSTIVIYIGDKNYTIPVNVSDVATDQITAQVNGADVNDSEKPVNLDVATSQATTAVKTAKIDFASQSGTAVSIALYSSESSASPVTGNANTTLYVAADGTITAGNQPGTVYLKITSATDAARRINGTTKWVKVIVNSKAPAVISVSVPQINLDVKAQKSIDLKSIITTDVPNILPRFSMTSADATENRNVAEISGSTLTSKQVGIGTLLVTLPETTTTRETTASVKVNVIEEITKKASDLKVGEENIELKPGETSQVTASTQAAGSTITYTSSDPEIVSVGLNDGLVTAIKPGIVTITVSSSATDTVEAGQAALTVVVNKPDQVKPAKVTGLKIGKRTAESTKLTVKWKGQEGTYYKVEKVTCVKVGKKWKKTRSSKYVRNASRTTIKIKPTDTVKVHVRAIVDDEDDPDVKIVGAWSKALRSDPVKK